MPCSKKLCCACLVCHLTCMDCHTVWQLLRPPKRLRPKGPGLHSAFCRPLRWRSAVPADPDSAAGELTQARSTLRSMTAELRQANRELEAERRESSRLQRVCGASDPTAKSSVGLYTCTHCLGRAAACRCRTRAADPSCQHLWGFLPTRAPPSRAVAAQCCRAICLLRLAGVLQSSRWRDSCLQQICMSAGHRSSTTFVMRSTAASDPAWPPSCRPA